MVDAGESAQVRVQPERALLVKHSRVKLSPLQAAPDLCTPCLTGVEVAGRSRNNMGFPGNFNRLCRGKIPPSCSDRPHTTRMRHLVDETCL